MANKHRKYGDNGPGMAITHRQYRGVINGGVTVAA